jgi:hypothetical protein
VERCGIFRVDDDEFWPHSASISSGCIMVDEHRAVERVHVVRA